ncbi:TPA: RNA-directed DNA polymerase [Morganella morganii subsp. morganii]|nr:RNA-directed DNA polymerase [Morganella morganii subsp. morganii]
MSLLKKLLSKGFFPIQLPPNFTSSSFGERHKEISNGISKIIKANNKKNPQKDWANIDKYSVCRSSFYRRTTSILNPISYFMLAELISDNWGEINLFYKKSTLSLSKPFIDDESLRAISITKFNQLYERKIIDSAGYKYALVTDISSYFPSIYTHSIPWALDGKNQAKDNFKKKKKGLGDRIDDYCRNIQDGQTIGLPIGSDTSHIISEIIGTAIDCELKEKMNVPLRGFRYVDDFFLFFENRIDAEKALAILITIISNYELEINASKTKIIETKDLIEESWRYSLKKISISHKIKNQRNDIHNYFSSIFSLEKKYKDESIAKYALKQLSSSIIKKDNWDVMESYLLKMAYTFPNSIEIVSRFLVTYNYYNYKIDIKNIKIFVNSLVAEHSNASHHNEVCWLLWLSKELKVKLSAANVNRVLNMDSNACVLVLLDLMSQGLINRKYIPESKLEKYISSDSLKESSWLVSYEGGKRKWLGNNDISFIEERKEFKLLLDEKVSFYDEKAIPPMLFNINNEHYNNPLGIDLLLNSDDDITDKFKFNNLDEEYFDNNDEQDEWDDDFNDDSEF